MRAVSWQSFRKSFAAHLFWYATVFVVIVAVVIVCIFPIYFRTDDALYLEWASQHSPLEAFDPSQAVLLGMFRPLQNVTWWFLYQLFGLHALPYQLFLTLLYGVTFVLFLWLVQQIYSRRVALLSLAAYAVVFFPLTYVIFWLSDLTYVLEMFFAILSLCMLTYGMRVRETFFLGGVLAYVCAVLAKEPAAILVPAVALAYLLSEWHHLPVARRQKSLALLGALFGLGIAWVLFNPLLHNRQWVVTSSGAEAALAFFSQRWRFYARHLTAETGILIWASILYLTFQHLLASKPGRTTQRFYVPLLLSLAASLVLRAYPSVALAVLLVALPLLISRRPKISPGIIWFVLPLFGIMTVSYMVRTYLTEASFGIAIVMGWALGDLLTRTMAEYRHLPPRWLRIAPYILTAILGLAAVFLVIKVRDRFEALIVVSASRQNCRDVVEFTLRNLNAERADLVVIDYEDMGLDYETDILPLPDLAKAHQQKTLESRHLQRLLRIGGASEIRVHRLEWLRAPPSDRSVFVVVMNMHERQFLESLGLQLETVYSVERHGEGAWIFLLNQ